MTAIADARRDIQYALNYSTALVKGDAVYDAGTAAAAADKARAAAKVLEKVDQNAAHYAGKGAEMLDRIEFDGTGALGRHDAVWATKYLRLAALEAHSHDYRADLPEFVRYAYGHDRPGTRGYVSDEQLTRITSELISMEKNRSALMAADPAW